MTIRLRNAKPRRSKGESKCGERVVVEVVVMIWLCAIAHRLAVHLTFASDPLRLSSLVTVPERSRAQLDSRLAGQTQPRQGHRDSIGHCKHHVQPAKVLSPKICEPQLEVEGWPF
jgi:hypothetical protein